MPYLVTLYPQERTDYTSGLYAGLFELRAAGEVVLRFTSQRGYAVYEDNPAISRIDVDPGDGRRVLKICFDNADWSTVASLDDLRMTDIYFKRSYHAPYTAELEPALRRKVLPMGLLYGCTSRHESLLHTLRDAFAFQVATNTLTKRPLKALKGIAANSIKRAREAKRPTPSPQLPLYIDEFEAGPNEPAEPKIFYRTRVYGPADAPDNFRVGRMNEVNELRANTVRTLKARFGDRFVGGLRYSAYAQATYPDCLHSVDSGLRSHLAASKTCLINVNTAGLHDSTSWKIPEYMAASRCVVSEPMLYESSPPLDAGTHYLPFTSPAECVAACERLLGDPNLARTMRAENFRYYSAHIRPDRLMAKCLQTAFDHCG